MHHQKKSLHVEARTSRLTTLNRLHRTCLKTDKIKCQSISKDPAGAKTVVWAKFRWDKWLFWAERIAKQEPQTIINHPSFSDERFSAIWCKISTSSHRPQKPSLQSQLGLKAHPKTAPFQPGLAFDNPEFKHDSPFPFEVGGSDLRHRSWHRIHGVHGRLPCNFERNAASPPGTHGFWIGTSALNPCDTLMPLKKLMGPMSWGPWSISLILR